MDQGGGADTDPYTGSECVTAGLPAACVVDFIPKVTLKGTLRLILDDQALDQNLNTIEATGVVVDFKKGKKKATLVDLFEASGYRVRAIDGVALPPSPLGAERLARLSAFPGASPDLDASEFLAVAEADG